MTVIDEGAAKAESVASKKVGPFPLIVWIGAGAALVILMRLRGARAAKAISPTQDGSGMVVNPYQTAGNLGGIDVPNNAVVTTVGDDVPRIDTNDDWVYAAGKILAMSNPTTATTIIRRLRNYTQGGTFPTDEYVAINEIANAGIQKVGPPPYPTGALVDGGAMPSPNVPVPTVPLPSDVPGPLVNQPLSPPPTPASSKSVVHFNMGNLSVEDWADYYYGDRMAFGKFYISTPGDFHPETLRPEQMYGYVLAAPPEGRIRD